MSRVSQNYKVISFYIWDTTISGTNPYTLSYFPVDGLMWIERGPTIHILDQTIITYSSTLQFILTHTPDPYQRIYKGFKQAFKTARSGNSSDVRVDMDGPPLTFMGDTSRKKPDLYITKVDLRKMP